MSRKHLLILSLLVAVPLLVFLLLGHRLVRGEQERTQRQFQELLRANLGEVDRAITSYFATQEQHLLNEDLGKASVERLRSILRKEATFEQILVLDPDGTLIFPNPDQPLSRREADYLVKIEQLLTDRNLTRLAAGESSFPSNVSAMNQAVQQRTPSLPSKFLKPTTAKEKQRESSTSAERGYGWYTWYWGQGLQVLHWQRLDNGGVLAVGLQRARWMADIIAILPDSPREGDAPDTSPAQIRLVNAGSRTVYQWGTKTFSKDEPPLATLNLSSPLKPWQLQHYGPSQPLNTSSSAFLINLIAAGGVVTAGLLGLAIYLSREIGRQMREARQRVSFVNQVSHELKTPLTNIRMYADLLENDIEHMSLEESSRARAHLSVITSESGRLSRLINNVLSLARLRRNTSEIRRQQADVDQIIRDVIDQFRPSLEELQIDVVLHLEAEGQVSVDVDAVEQMLGNLISNVEKYAADGKRLQVSSRRNGEATLIDVVDRGPGISMEFAQRVFVPFERASDHIESAAGTGIGLAIAQGLARRHGGDLILIDDQAGAHFRLSLHTPSTGRDK